MIHKATRATIQPTSSGRQWRETNRPRLSKKIIACRFSAGTPALGTSAAQHVAQFPRAPRDAPHSAHRCFSMRTCVCKSQAAEWRKSRCETSSRLANRFWAATRLRPTAQTWNFARRIVRSERPTDTVQAGRNIRLMTPLDVVKKCEHPGGRVAPSWRDRVLDGGPHFLQACPRDEMGVLAPIVAVENFEREEAAKTVFVQRAQHQAQRCHAVAREDAIRVGDLRPRRPGRVAVHGHD